MPELPEVEFAARNLRRWLEGRAIERVVAPPSRIFRGTDRRAFERRLVGRRLQWVERRGKILLLAFDGDVGFSSHLGMTGKWVRRQAGAPAPGHVRASLELQGDGTVFYDDPRLFGRIGLHRAGELMELPEVRALGPDPLVDGLDPEVLHARLSRTARPVKVALMDQAVIAGVGNVQATEALFRARIHPARPANSLSAEEVRAVVRGIEESIAHTLAQVQGDEITYLEERRSENPFLVYRRAGAPCPRCGTILQQMTLGGRSSAFCPRCQRA